LKKSSFKEKKSKKYFVNTEELKTAFGIPPQKRFNIITKLSPKLNIL
jgi:hypothetical protein